jgi:hypothetical protein
MKYYFNRLRYNGAFILAKVQYNWILDVCFFCIHYTLHYIKAKQVSDPHGDLETVDVLFPSIVE